MISVFGFYSDKFFDILDLMIDCQLYIVVVAHRMFLPFFPTDDKTPSFFYSGRFLIGLSFNFWHFLDAGASIVPAGIETYSGRSYT